MIASIGSRRAFRHLADAGRRTRSETLWCIRLDDPETVPPRVAFSLGRSVGSAVARNRVRRRLRAILCSLAGSPLLADGWVLIGARAPRSQQRSLVELTFVDLTAEVRVLLSPPATAR